MANPNPKNMKNMKLRSIVVNVVNRETVSVEQGAEVIMRSVFPFPSIVRLLFFAD